MPPPITPTFAWYDASDTSSIVLTGSAVSSMNDKSGNGFTLVPGNGASIQLQSGVDALNGHNVLTIQIGAGGGQTLNFASGVLTQAQPITILLALQFTAVPSAQVQIVVNGAGTNLAMASGTGADVNKWAYYASTLQTSTTVIDTKFHVWDAIFNGASSQMDLDGVSLSTANPGTTGIVSSTLRFGFGAASFLLCEALLYSSALSGTNLTAAISYLNTKWNPSAIKTIGGLPKASVKTIGGLTVGSVKTIGGLPF